MKKYIVSIAFALSLSALATAEPQPGSESDTCVLMLPAGTTVGALFDPRIYMCTAQVRGAPTDEIGFQKSKANAQAA